MNDQLISKHERRAQAARRAQGKKVAIWGLIILAVAAGIWLLMRGKSGQPSPTAVTVGENDHMRGPKDAAVTMVEFADFQCPACGAYHPVLQQLEAEFSEELRVVFKHFPLTQIHRNALPAGIVTEAAGRQGKFWEMHDLLFERQDEWSDALDATDKFAAYAEELGLDGEQFASDIQDEELRKRVLDGVAEGTALGVRGTPTFFVNGRKIENPRSYETFSNIIRGETAIPE